MWLIACMFVCMCLFFFFDNWWKVNTRRERLCCAVCSIVWFMIKKKCVWFICSLSFNWACFPHHISGLFPCNVQIVLHSRVQWWRGVEHHHHDRVQKYVFLLARGPKRLVSLNTKTYLGRSRLTMFRIHRWCCVHRYGHGMVDHRHILPDHVRNRPRLTAPWQGTI